MFQFKNQKKLRHHDVSRTKNKSTPQQKSRTVIDIHNYLKLCFVCALMYGEVERRLKLVYV